MGIPIQVQHTQVRGPSYLHLELSVVINSGRSFLQKTYDIPVTMGIVQNHSCFILQAEKNRAAMLANLQKEQGPTRLYVGSLHCNITEPMLKAIFEPFGYVSLIRTI